VSDRGIEVNDRRMFLPDGSLRSEYSYLEDESRPRPAPPAPEVAAPEPAVALPETPPDPAFLDLIEMVAQNAAAYLAQANGPGGAQYLSAAKGFLGMLEAVHRKTEGHLAEDEKRLLADVIGRLNLALAPKSPRG
jgi:hypothetical protein